MGHVRIMPRMRLFPLARAVRPCSAAALAAVLCVLVACAPALDWREVNLPGAQLQAAFPCRPVAQERRVVLAGRELSMRLHACEAAGATFAVSLVDVTDPGQVGPVLAALRASVVDKLEGAVSHPGPPDWRVPGMTPQALAGRARWAGAPGQAADWSLETGLFARGTWVAQATCLGVVPPAQAATFFDALRFGP